MSSNLGRDARELIQLAKLAEQELPRNKAGVRHKLTLAIAAAAGSAAATTSAGASLGAAHLAPAAAAAMKGASLAGKSAAFLKVLGLIGVVGVASVGVRQVQRASERPVAASAQAKAQPKAAQPLRPAWAAMEASPVVTEPAAPPVTTPAKTESRKASRPGEPRPQPQAETRDALEASAVSEPQAQSSKLSGDLGVLRAAQQALNSGAPARALEIVRTIQGSELSAERTALEVFASCALGKREQAREKAVQFRAMAPTSPLLPRVNGSCAKP